MKLETDGMWARKRVLSVGVRITGPGNAWTKFAVLRIPVEEFDRETLRWLLDQVSRLSEEQPADQDMLY